MLELKMNFFSRYLITFFLFFAVYDSRYTLIYLSIKRCMHSCPIYVLEWELDKTREGTRSTKLKLMAEY